MEETSALDSLEIVRLCGGLEFVGDAMRDSSYAGGFIRLPVPGVVADTPWVLEVVSDDCEGLARPASRALREAGVSGPGVAPFPAGEAPCSGGYQGVIIASLLRSVALSADICLWCAGGTFPYPTGVELITPIPIPPSVALPFEF